MADQHKADLVMKFILDGNAVPGECALVSEPTDLYMSDFTSATYQNYSDFFEVQKFEFEFEVKDEDESKKDAPATNSKPKSRVAGEFASWRSAKKDDARKMIFPLQFDSVKFDRIIDAASPVFFNCCVSSKSFDKAILVKRVSLGADKIAQGFLRLEFTNVLITSLSWDDGDMTTEKCEFICRDFKMQYRQLQANGTWAKGVVGRAHWNYQNNALPTR